MDDQTEVAEPANIEQRPGPSADNSAPQRTPPDLTGKTVWVVDANSLIFQVFHALPEMSSPKGAPVSAVFGFTRDVMYLLEEKKPDYLLIAFDRPEPTFRHAAFAGYKDRRSEMPVDLGPQFAEIHRVLTAMHVPILECAGYEADDILATIAHDTEQAGGECVLVTGDKDCRQLISDRVKVYNIRKNQMLDAAALAEDWGIRPDQVIDYQALVGDSVDSIPGVPLIGPKVACELLTKYDTLDQLLARANELPSGKRKDNLIAHREQALASRELARLERRSPVALDWSTAGVGPPNVEQLRQLFAEYGFHRLTEKMTAMSAKVSPAPEKLVCETVGTPQKLASLVEKLGEQKQIALDVITTATWPRWAKIVGYSFAWDGGQAFYVPVSGPTGETCLDAQTTLEALRPILENPAIEKIGQNLKYDLVVLRAAGVELAGVAFDTMIAAYLLDAGERNHDLHELAQRYLSHATTKITALTGTGKTQKPIDEVPIADLANYAGEQAAITWRLRPILEQRLKEANLDKLFHTLEVPLIEVLAELEFNGIRVDTGRLAELSEKFGAQVAVLEREIYDLAGHEFNIGSPKQLQTVLFVEQKLPVVRRNKQGGSTDVDVLEELAQQHPLPAKIIEYRQFAKLKNTYVDALPAMVHPTTGRVHTSFNQVVAATGRLSSNDPNLQNIPIRNAAGRAIRAAFLPGHEGWRLLAADYSQIELRVLAHFSGDSLLREAFAGDVDIHAQVASQVHKVPLAAVTSEMRREAKAVNFGVIYGQSPFGLAKQLGIPQDEAAQFIDAYFDLYHGVEEFLSRILEDCVRNGYVSTILGRRRAISGIRNVTGRQRNLPERTAINTVIQGSAADLIKLAMLHIHRRLRRENLSSRMLLQIHDELVFEVPPDEIQCLAQLVADEMSGVLPLAVPLKVDLKCGSNWADCEPM